MRKTKKSIPANKLADNFCAGIAIEKILIEDFNNPTLNSFEGASGHI